VRRAEDAETSFAGDMRELARSSGADYVDGAELLGAPFLATRANFADAEHMNETGAARFSAALAERLRATAAPRSAGVPPAPAGRLARRCSPRYPRLGCSGCTNATASHTGT